MKVFSAYAIAEMLELDRQTVVRALRKVPADASERRQPRWKMVTAVEALERHKGSTHNRSNSNNQIDPTAAVLFARFDAADEAMHKFKTVDQRRKAAIGMGPLLTETDALVRKIGLANNQDPELVHLRADRILLLQLRGFEEPCQWSHSEAWEALFGER